MAKENPVDYYFCMFWDWRLTNSPEYATSIGIHKYDNRLDEMSLNSYLRRTEGGKAMLDVFKDFQNKNNDISLEDKLNIKLITSDLEQFLNGIQFKSYLCPLNKLEGPQLDFPRLLSWMKKDNVNHIEMIIARMRLFTQQIDETIALLTEGIRLGMIMHQVSISTVPKVLKDMADVAITDSAFFKPFLEKPKDISEDQWGKLIDEAKKVIEEEVKPSFIKLANFLEKDYFGLTRKSIGASSLPNGHEFYAACLAFHTTTTLTPKEVHDIGIKEVDRITKCMIDVKEQLKFSGTLKDFCTHLRTDSKFAYKEEKEILDHYKTLCRQIEEKLPDYFHVLPKAPYEVIPVPSEVAASFPGAYYLAPPDDGSRPGTFYINTYKPETRKRYEAVSLSLHEAVPGHHLQTSLTMESGSSPDFRRLMEDRKYYEPPGRFSMNTGYVEGWGLYSEYLGEEMGLYSDPIDMFGRLSHEMLRASRLVVDTGMHAFEWSREKAIEYMAENTACDMHDITSEIDRYITWPGQACGYKIGEIKIKEIREKAETKLGDKFDLKMFHHTIAAMGGVPLNILESEIDNFIQKYMKM